MSAETGAPNFQRKRFQNPSFSSGGLFDIDTYIGTWRAVVLCMLIIYGGRHIDSFGQWLWGLFGEELHIAPGKAEWHARVAFAMGATPLVLMLMNLLRLFRLRRYLAAARTKTDEEVALRLRELEERRASGQGLNLTTVAPELPAPSGFERWPFLHDMVWGWPLLLALPLMLRDPPVATVLGLVLGACAYGINHKIANSRMRLSTKFTIALSVGVAAVGLWYQLALRMIR